MHELSEEQRGALMDGCWMRTFSGRRFYPLAPRAEDLHLLDIAHALSHQCRFAGHVQEFYSVAQHSVIVSHMLEEEGHPPLTALTGLLHDAPEAYLMDLPTPVKRLMPEYRQAEDRLWAVIRERFQLEDLGDVVKRADLLALAAEARDLMGDPQDWEILRGLKPPGWNIVPYSPLQAKVAFEDRYRELIAACGRPPEVWYLEAKVEVEGVPV